ncbi:MAG: VOC family protein [Myxococcota bacterium]
MNPNKLFPLVITDKLDETKAYYTGKAGFVVTFENDNYLQVRYGDDEARPELAFMRPSGDTPMGPTVPFGGQGLIVSVPTKDADDKHQAMRGHGAQILSEPSDKPWGWRSFTAVDPNGVILDFFHESAQSSIADATG